MSAAPKPKVLLRAKSLVEPDVHNPFSFKLQLTLCDKLKVIQFIKFFLFEMLKNTQELEWQQYWISKNAFVTINFVLDRIKIHSELLLSQLSKQYQCKQTSIPLVLSNLKA